MTVQDLLDLDYGNYFDSGVYDVYMKLLKVFNLIMRDLASVLTRNSSSEHSEYGQVAPRKVLYLGINEIV